MSSKIQNSKNFIINILITLIPITYILGNLLLNINILIFLTLFFWLYRPNFFSFEFKFFDKFIIFFFVYILLNGLINNFFNFPYENFDERNLIFYKTLGYLRFLLLYFAIRYLIFYNKINFKYLYLVFGCSALFVSLDIIYQFFFRVDLFGFEAPADDRRLAGPFGDEWIAGSFIQRFYIFLIFYILIYFKLKEAWKFNGIFFSILFVISIGIFMSGNRIPAATYLLSVLLLLIFEKSLRKKLAILVVIFLTSFYFFGKNTEILRTHYAGFIDKSIDVLEFYKAKYSSDEKYKLKIPNSYVKEFETGFLTWNENKIFGGGIKSFYYNCKKIEYKTKYLGLCPPHPHNYYIQLGAELGLVGLIFAVILFSLIFFKGLKVALFKLNTNEKNYLLPFLIIFFVELFPLKTTGSLFTTTNSTFIFILIPFIVGLIEKKKNLYGK